MSNPPVALEPLVVTDRPEPMLDREISGPENGQDPATKQGAAEEPRRARRAVGGRGKK